MLTFVFAACVLLLLNGLFVAAEFAAVSARESRILRVAESGNKIAATLLAVMQAPDRLDRYISACQLGITVTSLALGAYAQVMLVPRLAPLFASGEVDLGAQGLAVLVTVVGITAIQVCLAEQVPKSIALHVPDRVALYTVLPVRFCQWLFHYVVRFCNGSSQLVLRLLRVPSVMHRHIHSRKEIDLMMEQSHEQGSLAADEHERLQHVLELDVVTARQLMVPRPDVVGVDLEQVDDDGALARLMDGRYTRLPVYRESLDEVDGILHTKDLARHVVEKGSIKDWRKLVRPVTFVYEGMTAARLLATFREKQTQQAMVMDEFGGVAGLVTLEDVLTHVFGEVGDEFSRDFKNPQRLAAEAFRFPGRMRLDEVEEILEEGWDGQSTTVGGFVAECLGHLPEPGERFPVGGYEVEVEAVENRVVAAVLVRRRDEAVEAETSSEAGPDSEAEREAGA